MKILQVLLTLRAGGAEGFITNLSVSLKEAGANVTVFLLAGLRGERGHVLYDRLRRADIEVIGANERKRGISLPNLIYMARLPLFIQSWSPDIVQVNHLILDVPCALARILRIRSGTCFVRRLAGSKQIAAHRSPPVDRLVDCIYHQTIACSPAVAEAHRKFVGKRNGAPLAVISNGSHLLDSIPTAQDRTAARQSLAIPNGAFVVGHIGGMWPGNSLNRGLAGAAKAHDVLLKSFACAFAGEANSVLLLVGDGPLRSDVEHLARSLGLSDRVRLLGETPEPWPVLKAIDVFCFPSRYEGLPNVLPEAASCGLPVIASDIPEIRHLYPGDAWLLRPVDDVAGFAEGMRLVRERKEEFGGKAYAAAQGFRERFSMAACAQEYLKAYNRICSSQRW